VPGVSGHGCGEVANPDPIGRDLVSTGSSTDPSLAPPLPNESSSPEMYAQTRPAQQAASRVGDLPPPVR